eukprot:SM000057S18442  [mRNA]  locus=s57:615168:616122:+ [translate_table: standard]
MAAAAAAAASCARGVAAVGGGGGGGSDGTRGRHLVVVRTRAAGEAPTLAGEAGASSEAPAAPPRVSWLEHRVVHLELRSHSPGQEDVSYGLFHHFEEAHVAHQCCAPTGNKSFLCGTCPQSVARPATPSYSSRLEEEAGSVSAVAAAVSPASAYAEGVFIGTCAKAEEPIIDV